MSGVGATEQYPVDRQVVREVEAGLCSQTVNVARRIYTLHREPAHLELLQGRLGRPAGADELAEGLPTAAVWAAGSVDDARAAGSGFEHSLYQIAATDDMAGVEYC